MVVSFVSWACKNCCLPQCIKQFCVLRPLTTMLPLWDVWFNCLQIVQASSFQVQHVIWALCLHMSHICFGLIVQGQHPVNFDIDDFDPVEIRASASTINEFIASMKRPRKKHKPDGTTKLKSVKSSRWAFTIVWARRLGKPLHRFWSWQLLPVAVSHTSPT